MLPLPAGTIQPVEESPNDHSSAPLHYGELLNVGTVHGTMSITDFKPVDTIVLHGSPYATAQAAEAALKWDGPSTYSLNMGNGGSINFIGGTPPVNSIHVAS